MPPFEPRDASAECATPRCPLVDRNVPLEPCRRCGYLRIVNGAERRIFCDAPLDRRSMVEAASR